MSTIAKEWEAVCDDLGVEIVAPFCVEIGNNVTIHAELLVKHFGAPNGMLIVTDYDLIEPHVKQLLKAGYGFSVLEELSADESYDRETYVRMLSDWTWSGPEDQKPEWIVEIEE